MASPTAGNYIIHEPCPLSWFLKRSILFLRIDFDYFKFVCVCVWGGGCCACPRRPQEGVVSSGARERYRVFMRHSKMLGSGLGSPAAAAAISANPEHIDGPCWARWGYTLGELSLSSTRRLNQPGGGHLYLLSRLLDIRLCGLFF